MGSPNFTLDGFIANTELNVRVTGDDEMATLKNWFESLWADISTQVAQSLTENWAVKQCTPYAVYLKALYCRDLNQSQGGCICEAVRVGLGISGESFHPCLEGGSAPLLVLIFMRISPWYQFRIGGGRSIKTFVAEEGSVFVGVEAV